MVVAKDGMRILVVIVQHEAHMGEVLASKRGYDGSSS